jgi:hypothetical protein
VAGLLITIDGLEYAAATSGVTSMPTSDDDDWPSDLTLFTGVLEWPRETIRERCKPLDGDVDVSGMTFRLHDSDPGAGSASGRNWLTYLGTRGTLATTSTLLDAACDDNDTTVTVLSTASFASSGTIWIDQEAITYSGTTATEFTGCTRGAYGSKAAFHIYEPDFSYSSAVWAAFPSFEGRRVTLWLVDGSNVARVLWIGRIRNGPRLVDGNGPDAGAMFEIQCDHVWQSERELRLGANSATCAISGFDPNDINVQVTYSGSGLIASSLARGVRPVCATLEEALGHVQADFEAQVASAGVDIQVARLLAEPTGITFEAITNVGVATTALLTVGGTMASGESTESSDRRHPRTTVGPVPSALARVLAGTESTLPLNDASKLPAWTSVTTSSSPYTTTVRNVLVGDYDKDVLFVFEPSAVDTAASPHTVTGYGFLVPLSRDAVPRSAGGQIHLDREIGLRACPRVTTTQWMDGLRYGIVAASSVVSTGIDSRNWEWSRSRRAVGLAGSVQPDRIWYLDGRRTVADLVRSNLILDGIALGIRNGRVSPFALTPPMAADNTAAAFTASDYITKTTWQRNPDGIANMVEVESPAGTVVVNNQLSVARFGQGRAIKLRLDGSDDARAAAADPRELISSVLSHLNNFAEPTFVRRLRVSLAHATDVWIGDYVSVTDWLTPNGEGGRGPSGIICQVIGREIDLAPGANGGMTLEVLSYWQGLLTGISPCCRVTSIAGAVLSINVSYLGETSTPDDYADSTGSTYPFTFGDGGASWFSAGDKVKLVRRDVTTVTEETGLEVLSVSPGAGTSTITLTTSPVTNPTGQVWDLVFDNYGNGSTVSSHAQKFAWTGDYANDVIGTSTDEATRWAP